MFLWFRLSRLLFGQTANYSDLVIGPVALLVASFDGFADRVDGVVTEAFGAPAVGFSDFLQVAQGTVPDLGVVVGVERGRKFRGDKGTVRGLASGNRRWILTGKTVDPDRKDG